MVTESELDGKPRTRWIVLVPPLLAAAALVLIWLSFDLSSFRSLDQVRAALEPARRDPRAGLYVVAAFALLSPLFIPITVMVVATALTFGQLVGFIYALLGIYAAACTTYWAGRAVGAQPLLELSGPALRRATRALQTHAFWASLLSRVAPVGNFTVMNMIAGSMRIPFVPFLLGTAVGAMPGTLLIALFADQARAWLSGSDTGPRPWLTLGLLLVLFTVLGVLKLARKRRMR